MRQFPQPFVQPSAYSLTVGVAVGNSGPQLT